jgi:hypothetical protein
MVHAPTLYDLAHAGGMTTAQVDWVAIWNAPTVTWSVTDASEGSLGSHGYPSTDPELGAIFIASGRGIRAGVTLDSVNLAPTMAAARCRIERCRRHRPHVDSFEQVTIQTAPQSTHETNETRVSLV